jgi:hypothetical protein
MSLAMFVPQSNPAHLPLLILPEFPAGRAYIALPWVRDVNSGGIFQAGNFFEIMGLCEEMI